MARDFSRSGAAWAFHSSPSYSSLSVRREGDRPAQPGGGGEKGVAKRGEGPILDLAPRESSVVSLDCRGASRAQSRQVVGRGVPDGPHVYPVIFVPQRIAEAANLVKLQFGGDRRQPLFAKAHRRFRHSLKERSVAS